jgi:hypothetical protein
VPTFLVLLPQARRSFPGGATGKTSKIHADDGCIVVYPNLGLFARASLIECVETLLFRRYIS